MVFLVFLIPVFFIFGIIYWYDSSNETKIQEYLQQNKCKNIYSYRAKYKALCETKLVAINDYFILDFKTNEEINYNDIISVTKKEKELLISGNNKSLRLEFEDKKQTEKFEKSLTKKVPK